MPPKPCVHPCSPSSCSDLCFPIQIPGKRLLLAGLLGQTCPFQTISRLSVFKTDAPPYLISKIWELCGLCDIEYSVFIYDTDFLCVKHSLWNACDSRNIPRKLWLYMILIAPKNSQLAVLVKESLSSHISTAEISGSVWLNKLESLSIPDSISIWDLGWGGDGVPWLERPGYCTQCLSQEIGSDLLEPHRLECNRSCPSKSNWQD